MKRTIIKMNLTSVYMHHPKTMASAKTVTTEDVESVLTRLRENALQRQEHVRVQAAKIAQLDPSLCRLEGRIQALEAILQQTTDVSNPSTHLPRKRVQKQLLDCMTEALELRIGLATEPEMKTEKAVLEQLVSSVAELLGIPTPDPFAED